MSRAILSRVVGLSILLSLTLQIFSPTIFAIDIPESELLISSFKITSGDGQFFELYNNSAESVDMSTVQLAYYNKYDLSEATSSKLISLSGSLAPGGYYLVNDSSMSLCYQTMVASASLGFSSTAGMVQVHKLYQEYPGSPISSQVVDSVAWSKTSVVGVQTLPSNKSAFLQRTWSDTEQKVSGGGGWLAVQPSEDDPCILESFITSDPISNVFSFLPSTLPPVSYITISDSSAKVNRNPGKMAPVINELLPNPASPQTDADDEFIELYNPNDSGFDLSGFKLAFGSTNPRKFTVAEGTILLPKTFTIFTSGDTSISLSNTGAQVWLLDPNDQIIDQSQPYSKAPDGQSWALDNGNWVWSMVPTPGKANTIGLSSGGSQGSVAAVLGISTVNGSLSNSSSATSSSQSKPAQADDAAPIHPGVLVGVGLLAVGYALYEYRQDIANRIFQLRRYLAHRRALRQSMQGQ